MIKKNVKNAILITLYVLSLLYMIVFAESVPNTTLPYCIIYALTLLYTLIFTLLNF